MSNTVLAETGVREEHSGGLTAAILRFIVSILLLAFATGNFPEITVPEWVYWCAFGIGYIALVTAAHKLSLQQLVQRQQFVGRLWIFCMICGAACGMYIVALQPDLNPLRPGFQTHGLQSIVSITDSHFARQQAIGLLLATTFASIVGNLLTGKRIILVAQVAIAITVAGTTGLLISVTSIVDAAIHSRTDFPALPLMLFGIFSLGPVFSEFKRPSWTEAPVLAMLTAAIPFMIGILGLITASGNGADIVASCLVIVWCALILYFGGRHILASRLSGEVKIMVAPNPVRVGATLTVQVRAYPRSGVRVDSVTAELLCEQESKRWDGETVISTVHEEHRCLTTDDSIANGEEVILETSFRIPLIGPLTRSESDEFDEGSWTVIVRVHFKGAPDHREAFDINVVA